MNSIQIIASMGTLAVVTSVSEKVAEALGQTVIANYIRVGGVSAGIITGIGLAIKALGMLKGL